MEDKECNTKVINKKKKIQIKRIMWCFPDFFLKVFLFIVVIVFESLHYLPRFIKTCNCHILRTFFLFSNVLVYEGKKVSDKHNLKIKILMYKGFYILYASHYVVFEATHLTWKISCLKFRWEFAELLWAGFTCC